jgi:hypothetical protein
MKNIITVVLMLMYLYTLTFDIFLNQYLRFPAALFCLPLITLFRANNFQFTFLKEFLVLFIANLIVYAVYAGDMKSFTVNLVTIIGCGLYFNFFIGHNYKRLQMSVVIFISFLILSSIVMLLDHYFHTKILTVRELLTGSIVAQSPSGIATKIFTFGYQLAALTAFLFIWCFVYKKPMTIKVLVLMFCTVCIFLGMQRSVLATFIVAGLLFLIYFYRFRSVFIIGGIVVLSGLLFSMVLKEQTDGYNNILAKNERNSNENRSGLAIENLKIYTDYPFGLVFHDKKWSEVVKNNPAFGYEGITSHNAYLMFITYVGPFVGLGLLFFFYNKVARIFRNALKAVRVPENALLICLCFAFLSVSLNSFFHNAWLVTANGPTLFLYFAILQYHQTVPPTDAKTLDE